MEIPKATYIPVASTVEIDPGVNADLGASGELAGLEILDHTAQPIVPNETHPPKCLILYGSQEALDTLMRLASRERVVGIVAGRTRPPHELLHIATRLERERCLNIVATCPTPESFSEFDPEDAADAALREAIAAKIKCE